MDRMWVFHCMSCNVDVTSHAARVTVTFVEAVRKKVLDSLNPLKITHI